MGACLVASFACFASRGMAHGLLEEAWRLVYAQRRLRYAERHTLCGVSAWRGWCLGKLSCASACSLVK